VEISSVSQVLDVINHPYWVKHDKGRASCPVHGGSNKTSFSFNKEVCFCHSCGFNGNYITLARELEVINGQGLSSGHMCMVIREPKSKPKPIYQEIMEVCDSMIDEADKLYLQVKDRIQRKCERDGVDAAYYTRLAVLDQRYDARLEQIARHRDNCLFKLEDTCSG